VSTETLASGRYEIERVLGHGAMSKVVLARDAELGRHVAIKVLDESLAADDSFRTRFTREARNAAALGHPNVVTVFDVASAEEQPYIVMEYVDGRTLHERLRADGPLRPNEVRAIALQVCAGLEHAHEHGIVHRDLKPGNLIERSDGTVKIADFGIARAADTTSLTEAGTIIGTAAYLAPEQAEGGVVSPATDVYALGIVLYELLNGKRPWQIETLADLARPKTEPLPDLPEHVPPDLRDVIARCLAPDPADRPQSAGEVAALLEGREDVAATVVLPRAQRHAASRRRRAERPRRPRPAGFWPAALLAALVLGLGALGLVVFNDGDDGDAVESPRPQRVELPPNAPTPEEDARNLAEWLRENSRGR
jgi:eukaryotic-like serine/threonine-protein kinase